MRRVQCFLFVNGKKAARGTIDFFDEKVFKEYLKGQNLGFNLRWEEGEAGFTAEFSEEVKT